MRESARGIKQEDEAQPVRTIQADEKARFEVASAVETDGDVRQDATREEAAITREEEKSDLAPAQVPDDGPDGDDEDAPEPINNALDQTISAGASVEGEQGSAEVEFDASPEATTFSANAADTTVNATVDHVDKQVTVEAGDAEFQVQAPAAVEEILPTQVAQSVDQAAQQAQAAVNTHLESLPSGEQVSETAIGQVTTWLDVQ